MPLKFPENKTIFNGEMELTFGQYKGNLVKDIVAHDPDYILWCIHNIEWFEVTLDLLDAVYDSISKSSGYSRWNPCDDNYTENYLDRLCGEGAWGW